MTYEEFKKEQEVIRKLEVPHLLEQQGIEWKMKCVFIDYGYGKISKTGALNLLDMLLRDWKDAQENIIVLKQRLDELANKVEF